MSSVSTLNIVFSAFDEEIISPMVYKVETVGQVCMPNCNIQKKLGRVPLSIRLQKLQHRYLSFFKKNKFIQVYMAVSGAPDINPLHAEHAADLALRLMKRIRELNLPGVSVKIGKISVLFGVLLKR